MLAGPYMTSLDMLGVSLSLIALSPTLTAALDASTAAPAWGRLHNIGSEPNATTPVPAIQETSKVHIDQAHFLGPFAGAHHVVPPDPRNCSTGPTPPLRSFHPDMR